MYELRSFQRRLEVLVLGQIPKFNFANVSTTAIRARRDSSFPTLRGPASPIPYYIKWKHPNLEARIGAPLDESVPSIRNGCTHSRMHLV